MTRSAYPSPVRSPSATAAALALARPVTAAVKPCQVVAGVAVPSFSPLLRSTVVVPVAPPPTRTTSSQPSLSTSARATAAVDWVNDGSAAAPPGAAYPTVSGLPADVVALPSSTV